MWNRSEFVAKAHTIRVGLSHAKSIDNYIRTHNADAILVGICKFTIAFVIAQYEGSCFLDEYGRLKEIDNRAKTWLEVFSPNRFAEIEVRAFSDQDGA